MDPNFWLDALVNYQDTDRDKIIKDIIPEILSREQSLAECVLRMYRGHQSASLSTSELSMFLLALSKIKPTKDVVLESRNSIMNSMYHLETRIRLLALGNWPRVSLNH